MRQNLIPAVSIQASAQAEPDGNRYRQDTLAPSQSDKVLHELAKAAIQALR
jgi:hypothetical protein